MNTGSTSIRTLSGREIDLQKPCASTIVLDDIAHGLSHVCRFAGQTPEFYSVAQHSILVSHLVPEPFAKQALLHDAAEAFMGDLHSALKGLCTDYREIEDRLMVSVYERFAISPNPLKPLPIVEADRHALRLELASLGLSTSPCAELSRWRWLLRPLPPKVAKFSFLRRMDEIERSAAVAV